MDETFSQLLTQYLKKCGLSQARLAKKIGVTPATISYWKKGKVDRPAKRETLLSLAVELNMTLGDAAKFLESGGHTFTSEDAKAFTSKQAIINSILTWATPGQNAIELMVDRPKLLGKLHRSVFLNESINGVLIYGIGGSGKQQH